MRRGQVNPRSWDAAIRAVQKDMLELAGSVPLSDEQDRILTAAFLRCGELTARRHLAFIATNRELAEKYGVSLRTITNWRREGCPFPEGQTRVLGWLAKRRYAPAGARARLVAKWKCTRPYKTKRPVNYPQTSMDKGTADDGRMFLFAVFLPN